MFYVRLEKFLAFYRKKKRGKNVDKEKRRDLEKKKKNRGKNIDEVRMSNFRSTSCVPQKMRWLLKSLFD
jgi:uncharacterized membrane protein